MSDAYIRTLGSPIDSYWEGVVIANSACYEILEGDEAIGHCRVGEPKTLLQFRVGAPWRSLASDAFGYLVSSGMVERAAVSTKEPDYLSFCLDRQKAVTVDSFLFSDSGRQYPWSASPDGLSFRPAMERDLGAVRERCDSPFDGYYEDLTAGGKLFVLYSGTALLGIGELRRSDTHPDYGDMGLCVLEEHRGKGIGTRIAVELKQWCYGKGLRPMASCDVKNLASRRALEKAGMIPDHRMLIARFVD